MISDENEALFNALIAAERSLDEVADLIKHGLEKQAMFTARREARKAYKVLEKYNIRAA